MRRALDGIEALAFGASAGGVDALLTLLPALPAATDAAFFVVLHVPRSQPSSLVEIFSHKCALPVVEAEDKLPIASGTVHVAPPDYHLLVDGGPALALSADDPVNYSRPSIDVLFESAADEYGPRLAAVLLTGANADGAAGLAAVRAAGGITIAQEPATAYAATMPAAAIARGVVDVVLPLAGIVELLRTLRTTR
jgi:two-component system chemotaxis response regulator CheB